MRARRFHFASDWTISTSLSMSFISNATGRSTPFNVSLSPESERTKSGAETRVRLSWIARSLSKKSLTFLIAT